MATFEFNDCGVCMNPEIVFHYKHPKALAWDYVELRICLNHDTQLWDFGYNYSSGSSPCTLSAARYTSKEEVIREGFIKLYNSLLRCLCSDMSKHIPKYLELVKDRMVYVTNSSSSPITTVIQSQLGGSQLSLF
jgi:hypothetical protein